MIVRTKRFAARLLLGASLLALPAFSAACRDSDDGDDGGGGTPDATPSGTPDGGPDNPDDTTVYEIQGDLAEDLPVNVRGVVVVAIDTHGSRTGTFYVAEPTGPREYSGVAVFGAPVSQLADIRVGDLVDIEGAIKDEFIYGNAADFGPSLTQLRAPQGGTFSVEKVGTGTVPEPVAFDPVAIGAITPEEAMKAAWEPWEGVLVKATNTSVTSALRQIGDDVTLKEFQIATTTRVDSGLTELPTVAIGDCYTSITGIVDYFYEFKIVPRQAADLVTTPGSCGGGLPTVTVEQIQRGEATGTVLLNDVIVTARDDVSRYGIWVSDAAQAAPYQGILVYLNNTVTPANLTIGSTVDVAGTVDEFDLPFNNPVGNKLTELKDVTVTRVDVPVVTPVALAQASIVAAADINDGEPLEGVLVSFTGLRIQAVLDAASGKLTLADSMHRTIVMDNDSFNYALESGTPPVPNPDFAVGTCFSSVTGVMNLDISADVRTFNPRVAGDLVRVACP
jgi:predicted extracellular nuclease